jgi:hypothetical protein
MKLLPFIHTVKIEDIYSKLVAFRFDISIPMPTPNTRLDDAFAPTAQDIKIKRLFIDNKQTTPEQVEALLGVMDIHEVIFDIINQEGVEPWNTYDSEDDSLY